MLSNLAARTMALARGSSPSVADGGSVRDEVRAQMVGEERGASPGAAEPQHTEHNPTASPALASAGPAELPAAPAAAGATPIESAGGGDGKDVSPGVAAPKRICVKWSDEDVEKLMSGIEKYGIGRWGDIVNESFSDVPHPRGTNNIMMKWRNMCEAVVRTRYNTMGVDSFNTSSMSALEQAEVVRCVRAYLRGRKGDGGEDKDEDLSKAAEPAATEILQVKPKAAKAQTSGRYGPGTGRKRGFVHGLDALLAALAGTEPDPELLSGGNKPWGMVATDASEERDKGKKRILVAWDDAETSALRQCVRRYAFTDETGDRKVAWAKILKDKVRAPACFALHARRGRLNGCVTPVLMRFRKRAAVYVTNASSFRGLHRNLRGRSSPHAQATRAR